MGYNNNTLDQKRRVVVVVVVECVGASSSTSDTAFLQRASRTVSKSVLNGRWRVCRFVVLVVTGMNSVVAYYLFESGG